MMGSFTRKTGYSLLAAGLLLFCGLGAWGQAQNAPPASTPAAATPVATAPSMDAPLDVKAANPPSTDDLIKGDPSGTKIGNVNDIVLLRPQEGPDARGHGKPGRPEPHRDQLSYGP